ncbi:putative cytosine deaminase [Crocosphaera subtropica ATCC 51142]|uniref:Cytosine deaminase n=1 Tax=Crocosphaera subtropica (strain ATCC 51142 / BH68) TaxID=43989 RepID=B1X0Q2_CROS5|nr:cytosine deaminase [Crocosphaera subtropica]ACB52941.1 putative cytosine deaminase [Crocosphaera subtropica ATCC 51142]
MLHNLGDRFWIKNAHIPFCLLENISIEPQTREQLCHVDLEINQNKIINIIPHTSKLPEYPYIDVKKGIIFPCFLDSHTHLDKGHIWERSPNLSGTFKEALNTVKKDAQNNWKSDDIHRRMEFGLQCSYAQGTIAIRTHLDAFGEQAKMSFDIFKQLKDKWQNKLTLQAVSLVSLDYFLSQEGEKLADLVAEYGQILGGVAYMNPEIDQQLDRVFILAKERDLDLDFHADETKDSDSICLKKIAQTAIKHQFENKIACGHCCSLAQQSEQLVQETIKLVKEANINVISLPLCNLYLQDRTPKQTPKWRGVTDVHALKKQGIPVIFASDNCRDPFYGFGNHDGLEILKESVRICHLDTPYDNWVTAVNKIPAQLMKLPNLGIIGIGVNADLVIFKARYFSELFARPQSDRQVMRQGKLIDTTLPDYSQLDELIFPYQR